MKLFLLLFMFIITLSVNNLHEVKIELSSSLQKQKFNYDIFLCVQLQHDQKPNQPLFMMPQENCL